MNMCNGLAMALLLATVWSLAETTFVVVKDPRILKKVKSRGDILRVLRMKLTEKQRRLDARRLADAKIKTLLVEKQRARQELWLRQISNKNRLNAIAQSTLNAAGDWSETTTISSFEFANSNNFHDTPSRLNIGKTNVRENSERTPGILKQNEETGGPTITEAVPSTALANKEPVQTSANTGPLGTNNAKTLGNGSSAFNEERMISTSPKNNRRKAEGVETGNVEGMTETAEPLTMKDRLVTAHTTQRNSRTDLNMTTTSDGTISILQQIFGRRRVEMSTPTSTVPVNFELTTIRKGELDESNSQVSNHKVATDQATTVAYETTSSIRTTHRANTPHAGSKLPINTTTWDPLLDPEFSGPLGVAVFQDVTIAPETGPLGVAVLKDVTIASGTNEATRSPNDGGTGGIQMHLGGTMPSIQEPRVQTSSNSSSAILTGFLSSISDWFASRRDNSGANRL